MIATNSIEKKITAQLIHLTPKQKKVVLSVVETFAEEQTDILEDKEFIAELDRRSAELESGKIKGYTLEQTMVAARKLVKAISKK